MNLYVPRYIGAALLLSMMGLAGCSSLQNQTKKTPPKDTPAPATHTVGRAPAKPKAQFDAVFESVEASPLKLEPKVWTDMTVVEAVPHGTRVKKGDVLVKLDLEKLTEQIQETEQDQAAAVLGLELAGYELENLQQTTPAKLDAARRAQRIADEDWNYFEKIGRSQREKSSDFNNKNAEQRLEGAQEELKQLEKMYKADDLTEDTEEIILKRTKFAVESAVYGLEVAKISSAFSLKTGIPREQETLKNAKRDQDLALALAEQTIPRALTKKRYDVEKLKRDQKKAEKRMADLKRDLELLSDIKAPRDGVVYYGACEAGKWTTGALVAKKLLPTAKLTANEVFMTVVNPAKLTLRAMVQEADLAQLRPGLEGKAAPVAAPDKKLPVKLEELGSVPLPTGGFEARLSVKDLAGVRVMPGMNCKVALGETQKADILTAPKEAVVTQDKESFVYLFKGGEKPEKRGVKTGESDGKNIEILQGLAEGDKILLNPPKP